jgi:hypothetical protein
MVVPPAASEPAAAPDAPGRRYAPALAGHVARWRQAIARNMGLLPDDLGPPLLDDFDADGFLDVVLLFDGKLSMNFTLGTADARSSTHYIGLGAARLKHAADGPLPPDPDGPKRGAVVLHFGPEEAPIVVYLRAPGYARWWQPVPRSLAAEATRAQERFPDAFSRHDSFRGLCGDEATAGAVHVGDYDGDGVLELAVVAEGALHFYENGAAEPASTALGNNACLGTLLAAGTTHYPRVGEPYTRPGDTLQVFTSDWGHYWGEAVLEQGRFVVHPHSTE